MGARFAFALLATLRAADAQDVFIPARQLRGSSNASVNITEETTAPSAELADTFPMIRLDSIVWVPSWRCPALSKMRTRRLPRKGGTMRQDCRLPCSTLGAGLSVSLTMSAPFV